MPGKAERIALVFALALGVWPVCAETLPSGTDLVVRLKSDVSPGRSGERFSAELAYPVFANGRQMIPAGSRVEGRVRGSKKAVVLSPDELILPDGKRLDFNAAVREINRKRLHAEEKEGTIQGGGNKADAARQAAEIGMTGAGVGAMTTGSVRGMGIGAAAGVAAVLVGRKIAGRHHSTVIPSGTQLTLSLTRPLDLPDYAGEANTPERRPAGLDERRPILRRAEPPTQ